MSYDPWFLGVTVPMPRPVERPVERPGSAGRVHPPDPPWVELAYTHFTVLLDLRRRLAAATAVNVDGAALLGLGRSGLPWYLDERVPASAQAGAELYARNDLDRGHLVRRRDPVWGDRETAARANAETFCFTNAAPQVATFNQSKELWLGLEDHVLDHADTSDARLSVLTGPVLAPDDPVYRDVAVPRAFWKVAAWVGPDGLAATGWLLDQSALLTALLEREQVRGSVADPRDGPVELGAFRTFQLPLDDVAATAGLDLGPLIAADRFSARAAASGVGDRRLELTDPGDIVL